MNRRLAAIAVADVVGYARLMEADEADTLAALKQRRTTVLEPTVRAHGGRVVKVMGDGVLIEFASAVNAVKAALELQGRMAEANAHLPEGPRIVLRIGINLGDVVGEGSDVYGEGVNIAARLEALAEPGGVCVSAKIHDEARGKIDAAFHDLGDRTLKNILVPVRAYSVSYRRAAPDPIPLDAGKPSIAVLPFANLSGDPDQQYFSDGITEDIITELSRFRSLFVVARNSSFQYRDKAVDARRIGTELGVRYLVEGSVRRMGARIRITAQLIEATLGNHLWSEKFDRSLEDLFDVQDEVTQTIVATVFGRIEELEIDTAATRKTNSLAAHDCLLRGIAHLRGFGPNENRLARELFEQAVSLDPKYALAQAYLALSLLVENCYGRAALAVKERAIDLASLAVRLDPREGRCHLFLGQAYRFASKFDLAVSHMEQALKLNPNDANAMAQFGSLLSVVGRAEEGIDLIRRSMLLDPYFSPVTWGALAMSFLLLRRYEEALEASARIGRDKRPWQLAREAACLAMLGRLVEARGLSAEVMRMQPDFRIATELPTYKREEDARHIREAMVKAGLPE